MERYSDYKDSGVKWLGEIPRHWEMKRWRFLMVENTKKNSDRRVRLQLQFRYGDIVRKANQSEESDVLDTISKYTVVEPNDIMINGLNLNYDFVSQRVAQVNEDGAITSAYISLRPTNIACPKYYTYFLKSMDSKKMFHGMGTGIRLTLSYNELKNQFIPRPSIEEQEAIANYLDAATSNIDKAIGQQQKMIDLLNERKQIIINNAVTKGLDPNVPMKDSGVEWIGEIPEHWDICALKKKAKIILGKMLSNNPTNKYKYICAKDVHYGIIDTSDLKEMSFTQEERNLYEVKKGDMLIVEGGAGAGGCAIFKEDKRNIYIQNSIMIIRGTDNLLNNYICLFMQSINQKGYIEFICNKATIPHFTKEKVGAVTIPLPPLKEQKKIVEYINDGIAPIEDVIQNCHQKIYLLQERKQIIINNVVTGKVKVI